jgi:hypothetical protein
VEDRRLRLIERVCRLPEAHVAELDLILERLERGDLPAEVGDIISEGNTRPGYVRHKDWPHAPVHRLSEHGTFIVTASAIRPRKSTTSKLRTRLLREPVFRHRPR